MNVKYRYIIYPMVLFLAGCSTKVTMLEEQKVFHESHNEKVCFLMGKINSKYKFVDLGQMKSNIGHYAGQDQLYRAIANRVRSIGGHAVIKFNIGQGFGGPFPWRFVIPKASGYVIRFTDESPEFDCLERGGKLY